MYETEFTYKLKVPFDYARDAKRSQAMNILVKCPTNAVLSDAAIIDAEVRKADAKQVKDAQEMIATISPDMISQLTKHAETSQKQKTEMNATDLVNQLIGAGLSLQMCSDALCRIMVSRDCRAMVDGVEPFTSVMFNCIALPDTKALLGEYIKHFLLSSQG